MTVTHYNIIMAWSKTDFTAIQQLAKDIDNWITQGWQPIGGVSTTAFLDGGTVCFCASQAIVRYAS